MTEDPRCYWHKLTEEKQAVLVREMGRPQAEAVPELGATVSRLSCREALVEMTLELMRLSGFEAILTSRALRPCGNLPAPTTSPGAT